MHVRKLPSAIRESQHTLSCELLSTLTCTSANNRVRVSVAREPPAGNGDVTRKWYCTSLTEKREHTPVEPFRVDDPKIHLNDWIPSLERAAQWYQWTQEV